MLSKLAPAEFSQCVGAAAVCCAALAVVSAYTSHFVGGWAAVRSSRVHGRYAPPCSLAGKVALVTGGNAGIGWATVRELARLGCKVLLCCRSLERGEAAKAALPAECRCCVEVMELDLASLSSIRAFVERFRTGQHRLDVLVLNAGKANTFLGHDGFRRTSDGFEEMIGVNFLGHYLLARLLLPVLRATQGARVIACTSVAAANSYPEGVDSHTWTQRHHRFSDWMQYSQSKLALLLFIRQLQQREPSLLCLACHPGLVAGTTLMHEQQGWAEWLYSQFLFRCLAMRAEDGWRNVVYLAATQDDQLEPGGFYFPVGRLVPWPWQWAAHAFQRAGAFQAPVRMKVHDDGLWDKADSAIRTACSEQGMPLPAFE
mmetsp:Transcript_54739/g.175564  ORF Transcript_54739/g.175564 Transcript_54739/m.175564 type:complete len:372 (-) Transcript_54739:47-1162(-)